MTLPFREPANANAVVATRHEIDVSATSWRNARLAGVPVTGALLKFNTSLPGSVEPQPLGPLRPLTVRVPVTSAAALPSGCCASVIVPVSKYVTVQTIGVGSGPP